MLVQGRLCIATLYFPPPRGVTLCRLSPKTLVKAAPCSTHPFSPTFGSPPPASLLLPSCISYNLLSVICRLPFLTLPFPCAPMRSGPRQLPHVSVFRFSSKCCGCYSTASRDDSRLLFRMNPPRLSRDLTRYTRCGLGVPPGSLLPAPSCSSFIVQPRLLIECIPDCLNR